MFLDDTGSDSHDSMRQYSYSAHGRPLVSHKLLVRGERINCIAFMSMSGILDCKTYGYTDIQYVPSTTLFNHHFYLT